MLLYRRKTNNTKSLSMFSGQLQTSPINQTGNLKNTKALQYARLPGSLTLEHLLRMCILQIMARNIMGILPALD